MFYFHEHEAEIIFNTALIFALSCPLNDNQHYLFIYIL